MTTPSAPTDIASLRALLAQRTNQDGLDWLDATCARVADDPDAIATTFPAVSRHVGRDTLDPAADPDDPFAWHVDDAGRTLLVDAVPVAQRSRLLRDLWRHGDARERRGVARSLDLVDVGEATDFLVTDALRTNDARTVAAALGPGGVAAMDDAGFAQAMLKALFIDLDLRRVAGNPQRVTPDLSRMMADFVHERVAAGRTVPATVWGVIDVHPPADRLAAIEAELDHDDPQRVAAATAALATRP